MKKTIIMLMVLLGASSNGFADEFVVKSFEEDPNDVSAVRHEKLDINDDPCAIIKVMTDLTSLIFDSNLGIEHIEKKEGELWLYVSPTEKRLTISKTGFIKFPYLRSCFKTPRSGDLKRFDQSAQIEKTTKN